MPAPTSTPALRHGVDLVEIERIEHMLREHGARFVQRCFTDAEAAYADRSGARRAQHFAARFACKEAVLKALGTGWRGGIAWTDIEVVRDANGAPELRLTGRCRELASEIGIADWAVSLSHGGAYAMASVVATVPTR